MEEIVFVAGSHKIGICLEEEEEYISPLRTNVNKKNVTVYLHC